MKNYFDFASAEPPALSEKTLWQRNASRTKRRQIILLPLMSLLWNVCFCASSLMILRMDFKTGAAMLIFWAVGMIGSIVISAVFFYQRKENGKWQYHTQ